MKDNNTIVIKANNRPYGELIVAAICFTFAIGGILSFVLWIFFEVEYFEPYVNYIGISVFLMILGFNFSLKKQIHINLSQSKFKTTKGVGSIGIGRWRTIENYEYVSLFVEPATMNFVVRLWCNGNRDFTLYESHDFELALGMAYDLSEELNIDLLDATIPNDYKWIDKEKLKNNT